MSKVVRVPNGKSRGETATLLLAAAEGHEQGFRAVRTTSDGFLVPQEVADEAGVEYDGKEEAPAKSTTKKTAAKKTAKKSASKDKE